MVGYTDDELRALNARPKEDNRAGGAEYEYLGCIYEPHVDRMYWKHKKTGEYVTTYRLIGD